MNRFPISSFRSAASEFHLPVSSNSSSSPVSARGPMVKTLMGLFAPGWTLHKQLRITIEMEDDGSLIASDDQFAVYGTGQTIESAISDYSKSLIEYYELVELRSRPRTHRSTLLPPRLADEPDSVLERYSARTTCP